VRANGFLGGYSSVAWALVAVQAGGGLLVAAVVKYTDNILKAFATSASLVAVSVASIFFFNFPLSAQFVMGAALVIYSMFLYGGESAVSGFFCSFYLPGLISYLMLCGPVLHHCHFQTRYQRTSCPPAYGRWCRRAMAAASAFSSTLRLVTRSNDFRMFSNVDSRLLIYFFRSGVSSGIAPGPRFKK